MQIGAVLVFVACAVAIFVWVPQRDHTPTAGGEPTDRDGSVSRQTETESQETPFYDSQLERAKERAEITLNDFSALQDHFERNQLGSEQHLTRYNEIIDQANEGDILFGQREFEKAQGNFEGALEDLQQLIATIDDEFDESMERGLGALDDRDVDSARDAFVYASEIKPLEQSPQSGLQRVARLPQINELLRESERARLRGNWDEALSLLDDTEALDGLTPGLDERRDGILSARADEQLNGLLTSGHQALNQEDYEEADRLFSEVLRRRPGNSAAETGLQATQRARTLAHITELQQVAFEQEQELDLSAALQTYEQALKIDSTLEFAIEGRDRTREILTLSKQIDAILIDSGVLSEDEELESARQVLNEAKKYSNHSEEFDEALRKLDEIVAIASQYVPVVLLSDNATEVTLSTKGLLGAFERHELQLRPGRYQLIGSRDGRMDVRKTINVEQDMGPVSIICDIEI